MKILIDVDGVVADIHPEWLRLYNEEYNDSLQISDIRNWGDIITKSKCGTEIFKYLPMVYDNTKPMKGALDVIDNLRKKHEVFFVTSGMFKEKIRWLIEKGFSKSNSITSPSDVIIAMEKRMVRGAFQIDDYHLNLMDRKFPILFTQPWNEAITGVHRANNWDDVAALVEMFEGLQ